MTCVDELTIEGQSYSKSFAPFDEALFEARRGEQPEGHSHDYDCMVMKVQNWLIQVDGRNILIDSGFGNGKNLPGLGSDFSFLDTPFLENLAAAGVTPEKVDMVVISPSMSITSAGIRAGTGISGYRPSPTRGTF